MDYRYVALGGAVLLIIAGALFAEFGFHKPEDRVFDGYIVWLREGVVFAEKLELKSEEGVHLIEPVSWVVQSVYLNDLYLKARPVTSGKHGNRYIRARFVGREEDQDGYGKYASKITIKKLEDATAP